MTRESLRETYPGKNVHFNCKDGNKVFTDDYVLWLETQILDSSEETNHTLRVGDICFPKNQKQYNEIIELAKELGLNRWDLKLYIIKEYPNLCYEEKGIYNGLLKEEDVPITWSLNPEEFIVRMKGKR